MYMYRALQKRLDLTISQNARQQTSLLESLVSMSVSALTLQRQISGDVGDAVLIHSRMRISRNKTVSCNYLCHTNIYMNGLASKPFPHLCRIPAASSPFLSPYNKLELLIIQSLFPPLDRGSAHHRPTGAVRTGSVLFPGTGVRVKEYMLDLSAA